MLIALDENAAYYTSSLRKNGYTVISISEGLRGIDDEDVLKFALENGALLITEDKRFGEMVFRDRLPTKGVVLLRFPDLHPFVVSDYIVDVLNKYGTNLFDKFSVLSAENFRMHALTN
jgi:predicted nuclease of predicted toxin-antitoxin system